MPSACWKLQDEFKSAGAPMTLPEICQELHQMSTGSMDTDQSIAFRYMQILALAVTCWEPGPDFSKSYDDAVLNLVNAALDEARALISL